MIFTAVIVAAPVFTPKSFLTTSQVPQSKPTPLLFTSLISLYLFKYFLAQRLSSALFCVEKFIY